MAVKAKVVRRVPRTSKTYVKTVKTKNKGKGPKARANGKAPPVLLKRKSGKSGTRPKEILNRLRLRLEVAETALKVAETALKQRITITVKKRPKDAEPITLDQTMNSLAALPRDDIDILIYRLNALRSVL